LKEYVSLLDQIVTVTVENPYSPWRTILVIVGDASLLGRGNAGS
jgi:hypothetical protein